MFRACWVLGCFKVENTIARLSAKTKTPDALIAFSGVYQDVNDHIRKLSACHMYVWFGWELKNIRGS